MADFQMKTNLKLAPYPPYYFILSYRARATRHLADPPQNFLVSAPGGICPFFGSHGVWDWRRGGYGGTAIPGWTAAETNPHGGTVIKYPGKKSKALGGT